MQISTISEAASSSTQWNSAQSQSKSKSAAAPQFAAAQQSAPAAQLPAPAVTASSLPLIQDAVGSSQMETIAASYSTTVAGKNYSASVEESGGIYTASVPIPPGVSASGGSIESAEANLNIVLDTLA